VLAERFSYLDAVTRVLLRSGSKPVAPLQRLLVLTDALEIADTSVSQAVNATLDTIAQQAGITPEPIRFSELTGTDLPLSACNLDALRDLQTAEFQSTVDNWIETEKPELGFTFSMAYANVKNFDRIAALNSLTRSERLFEAINAGLPEGTLICFPTTPVIAPLKGSLNTLDAVTAFYDPTMTITAFSGVGRLPEISAPLLTVEGCPVGLSFAAGHYRDEFLLSAVKGLMADQPTT
jgi:amidase